MLRNKEPNDLRATAIYYRENLEEMLADDGIFTFVPFGIAPTL
jgi:hypothetical protein